jgi:hypothetical protein
LEFYPRTARSSEFFAPSQTSPDNAFLKNLFSPTPKPVPPTLADSSWVELI